MLYVCSNCHTRFQAHAESREGADGEEHESEELSCPTCRAEAGLEPHVEGVAPAMRYFGTIIAIALFGVVSSLLALVA